MSNIRANVWRIPVLRKPWLESMALLRCQDAKANESSGLGFPWLCDARSMLLLTCRFTRDSSTFFPRKLLAMTWFDMVCLIEIPTSLGIVYSFSTAPESILQPSHRWSEKSAARVPGSKWKTPAQVSFFFCRPSHFLGQLWPRSSKKKKMWRIETMAQRISSPPKKIPPKWNHGSVVDLLLNWGLTWKVCHMIFALSPHIRICFTNKKRITSPCQNAPFLSPIFYGYDAPFIRGYSQELWSTQTWWSWPRRPSEESRCHRLHGDFLFFFFKLIWPWINTYESPQKIPAISGDEDPFKIPALIDVKRMVFFLRRWLDASPWPIPISSFL